MKQEAQLLVFRLDDRSYALHLAQVKRVIWAVDYTPLPEAPRRVSGVIDVRGDIIPVLNIRDRFGLPGRDLGLEDQFIIAASSRRTVALIVDGVKEIIRRPAEEILAAETVLPSQDQVEGIIQLQDGLTLIHNLDRFLSLDEERALDDALTAEASHGK